EEDIINNYVVFSTSTSQQSTFSSIGLNDDQNYQYILTQLLQKVQRFMKQNSITATTLYNSFNEILVSEIENIDKSQSNNSKIIPTIRNPLIIRGKGCLSNKRITSTIELTSNKKKKLNKNKDNTNVSRSQDSINMSNYQSSDIAYNTKPSDKTQNSAISLQFQESNSLVQCFVETNFSFDELNL
ncbi:12599_t:CDS:1, partial [Racocetra persica]